MKFRCFSISSFFALASLLTLTAPAQTETLPGRLALLDRDKDNRISREEAGERPFFNALDRNKDGFITAAEAAQVMNRPTAPKTPPAEPALCAVTIPVRNQFGGALVGEPVEIRFNRFTADADGSAVVLSPLPAETSDGSGNVIVNLYRNAEYTAFYGDSEAQKRIEFTVPDADSYTVSE